MLEMILKLYVMAMATGVTSPLPHLIGPPGSGKSTIVGEAAQLVGHDLHVINVSRISPLDVEGVQMPHSRKAGEDAAEEMYLRLLTATFWTQLKHGDILLFDEMLRGFPEVYNGILDIITSRRVGSFVLPRVFILGASNSNVAYDKALEDRLLHLPVPDPRKKKAVKNAMAKRLVDTLGLMPEMAASMEMGTLMDSEVLPMYEVLDSFKNKTTSPALLKGSSLRKLIGQAQLRQVESAALVELIKMNNVKAMQAGKPQFVFLIEGRDNLALKTYEKDARGLVGNSRLTEVQALNLNLNLQLIEMESVRHEKEEVEDDDDDIFGA